MLLYKQNQRTKPIDWKLYSYYRCHNYAWIRASVAILTQTCHVMASVFGEFFGIPRIQSKQKIATGQAIIFPIIVRMLLLNLIQNELVQIIGQYEKRVFIEMVYEKPGITVSLCQMNCFVCVWVL